MDAIELLKRNRNMDVIKVSALIEYLEHVHPDQREEILTYLAICQFSHYKWNALPKKSETCIALSSVVALIVVLFAIVEGIRWVL